MSTAILELPNGRTAWECTDCGQSGTCDAGQADAAQLRHWAACPVTPDVMHD